MRRALTALAVLCSCWAVLCCFGAFPAQAEVHIDTSKDRVDPVSIAVPAFAGVADADRDVAAVIRADLERSGLFSPLDPALFATLVKPSKNGGAGVDSQPSFDEWRGLNAQLLLQGGSEVLPDGRIRLSMRLWDAFAGAQLAGTAYVTPAENWRRIAHIIADEVYSKITGEEGYFDSRIVYVSETTTGPRKVRRLAMMDQDGINLRFLTDGFNAVSSPRFSPTNQEIAYLSQSTASPTAPPRVLLLNIDNGHQEPLGDFPGLTTAPRFSPDGNKVILFMTQEGATGLYEMDLRTRRTRRIALRPGGDSDPCYAPDGKQVVFVSVHGSTENLFVMNADGSRLHRVSYGEGRYSNPVWSPHGDLIAFTKIRGGQAYIGVIKADGSGERVLSSGVVIENPTWSPNGRILLFYRSDRRGGDPALFSIDLTGFNERRVVTPTAASDPAWSPLLH